MRAETLQGHSLQRQRVKEDQERTAKDAKDAKDAKAIARPKFKSANAAQA